MSDFGGIKRLGKARFPTIRRSTDITQPEAAEAIFTQEIDEYLSDRERAIKETEEATKKNVDPDAEEERNMQNQEKEFKKKEKEEIEEKELKYSSDSNFIDIKA